MKRKILDFSVMKEEISQNNVLEMAELIAFMELRFQIGYLLELIETVSKGSQIDFYLGGYGNFDSFAKRCAKRYQQKHTNAKVIFVTPYLSKWLDDRKDYIEKEYDEILYPELEHTPPKYAISKRNEWMVRQSDYVFVYVKTHFGGAYNALLYAAKHNKPYTNLYLGNYELY